MPLARHRHHPRPDPRHTGGTLLLRRRKGRSQRRNLDPTALCPGRNLLHGAARRQPAGFELPDRSGRLCRPSRQTRHLPALLGRNPGGYSRLGFRRHPAHRRDADDHPVQTRDAGHHVPTTSASSARISRSNAPCAACRSSTKRPKSYTTRSSPIASCANCAT